MNKIIKEKPGELMPHEKHYQIGNIVKICKEPPKARRYGFLLGTEHVIVEPPKGYKNTGMAVWVKDKRGELKSLTFYQCYWTGKKVRIRRNTAN